MGPMGRTPHAERRPLCGGAFGPLLALALAFAFTLNLLGAATVRGAEDFGQPQAGRAIYDQAGVLTPAEVSDLEARAAAVVRAGAPTIVYVRAHDADEDETLADAQELMDAWNVQSATGARDGVVIFLNVDPDNRRRGQAALWAGERHAQGNLPGYELQRIYDDVMRPLLRDDQTAAGIGAGLDSLARSLTVGLPPPPQPSAAQRIASTIAGLPLALVAFVVAAGAALFGGRLWAARPRPVSGGMTTTQRPGDLPPAVAAALVARRIEPHALAEATLLDLARRGGIAMEPQGKKEIAVRLLDQGVVRHQFERVVWDTLAAAADSNNIVAAKGLNRLSKSDKSFAAALGAELEAKRWFAASARQQQTPFYFVGTVTAVLAVFAFIVTVVGKQPWGFVGIALLAVVSVAAFCFGWSYPQTTADGEAVAAPWHGYEAGLQAVAKERGRAIDLDAILPDAVAFGLTSAFDERLKEASETGYAPSWFVRQSSQDASVATFYPYWVVFHSTTSPSASSGGGSVSSGGAGGGGSF